MFNTELNSAARILIIIQNAGGLGDFAGGMRIANILNEKMGIPCKNIFLTAATKDGVNRLELFNSKKFTSYTYEEAANISSISLKIFFPAVSVGAGNFTNISAPMLMIDEYGFDASTSRAPRGTEGFWQVKTLGLESKDMGIFIDESLGEPLDRETEFFKLDPSLQSTLLKLEPSRESLDTFFKQNRLYAGYTHSKEDLSAFIGALAKFNKRFKDATKNIVVIAPGNFTTEIAKDPTFIEYLKDARIQNFEIQVYKKNLKTQAPVKRIFINSSTDSKGPNLTVIYGDFDNATVKLLAKVTKKQTITTGDQSVTEAISCYDPRNPSRFKFFAYSVPAHKTEFAKSLRAKYPGICTLEHFGQGVGKHLYEKIFSAFSQAKLEKYITFTASSEKIRRQYNCTDKITAVVNQMLQIKDEALPFLLDPNTLIEPKNFQFDKWYICSLNQILLLKISARTGVSQLKPWEDSLFLSEFIGDSNYLLMRKKKGSAQ
jgi:hypothetical protein